MIVEVFLDKLAEHGVVGLLLAIALIAIWKLLLDARARQNEHAEAIAELHKTHAEAIEEAHKALAAEKDARINDAKGYGELSLRLQAQVIDSVQKLAEIYKFLPAMKER